MWRREKRRGDLPAKNFVPIGRRLPHLLKAGKLLVPLLRDIYRALVAQMRYVYLDISKSHRILVISCIVSSIVYCKLSRPDEAIH